MEITCNEISHKSFLPFELAKETRNITGYSLFMSHFHREFKLYSDEKKKELLFGNLDVREDASDYDSTDSFNIPHVTVLRYGSTFWKTSIDERMRLRWKRRAIRLNNREINGMFDVLPRDIGNSVDKMFASISKCLKVEWNKVVKILLSSIRNDPCRNMSQNEYSMGGKNKTVVGVHSFRRCSLNSLIQLCVFGDEYCKLTDTEVVYRSKNMLIAHVASLQRMKSLFTLSGLCAVDFFISRIRYSCCGRVNLVCNGKNEMGYIMEEKEKKWKVQLANNKVIVIQSVCSMYDNDGNFVDYVYENMNGNKSAHKWTISMYWPVKMKFSAKSVENWQYMISRVAFKNGKIVPQISS